jgi:hypothetical protein
MDAERPSGTGHTLRGVCGGGRTRRGRRGEVLAHQNLDFQTGVDTRKKAPGFVRTTQATAGNGIKWSGRRSDPGRCKREVYRKNYMLFTNAGFPYHATGTNRRKRERAEEELSAKPITPEEPGTAKADGNGTGARN